MTRCHSHCSDSAKTPTCDQQLDAEQIQSLVDQRINVLLDSYPQRPCLPLMHPTGMPTQMPEEEQIQSLITLIDQRIKDHLGAAGFPQAVIPGYGGQPMSMTQPGPPSMPMQMNGLLRPPAMGPPPTVPGPTSNGLPNPGAKYQGNPTALDGCKINDAASGLQSPTQGSAIATSCLLTNEGGSPYLPPHVREAKRLANGGMLRFGSLNVGSLTAGKLIVDAAARSGVNILCVQEIKCSGRSEEEVDTGFKIWYRGGNKQCGVGILIDKNLKYSVFGVTRKAGIILVKLKVDNMVLNVISASAPQVGASEKAKWRFWKDLNGLVRSVPRIEKLFIGGDFHGGQVGTSGQNFERVHGGFGYGDINQEGEEILDFATAHDLMVANTFFRKEKSRIVTFIDGGNSSQINFFLTRRRDRLECMDCEVIPGGCVVSQHQLLVSDFVFGANFTSWKLPEDAPRVLKDQTMAGGLQQAVIPGYGGQPLSPPPTVPGGTTHTSNGLPNPGAKYQGNPITPVSGAVDGCNINDATSGLQRPTQGSAIATKCLRTNKRRSPCLPPHARGAKKLDNGSTVRFGSWNVGSLTRKLSKVVHTAARRDVNILCVQDIKCSGQGEEEVKDTGFKLWYRGRENESGVGILLDESLKNRVFDVIRKTRIILVKIVAGNMVLNVISASAPAPATDIANWRFWKDLSGLVRRVPRREKLFIGGDFLGGQVGTSGQNFERVHGGFGCGDKNQEGEEMLNFATAHDIDDLMVANTFFKKEGIVTFIDGGNSSQINFFLARRRAILEGKDCEVIPEECVGSQHQLLVSDFVFGANFTCSKLPEVLKDETMAGGVTKKRKKNNGRGK